MDKKKHIDDLFREELGGYTEAPPPAAWEALDKKLGALPPRNPRYRYRFAGYFAALLLVAFLTVPRIQDHFATEQPIVVASNTGQQQESAPVSATPNDAPPAQNETVRPDQQTELSADKETSKNVAPEEVQTTNTHYVKNRNIAANRKEKKQNTGNKYEDYNGVNTSYKPSDKGPNYIDNEYIDRKEKNNIANPEPEASATSKSETKTSKKEPAKPQSPAPEILKPDVLRHKPNFSRIEMGVKLGYERGFNNDAAVKGVFTPYLQYNISKKVSIMAQPGIKYAKVSTRRIGDIQSYYKVNNDAKCEIVDSTPAYIPTGFAKFDTLWFRDYAYSQSHDSIVKTSVFGGTYIEFELPILVKFQASKKMAIYAGPNAAYGKVANVTEHTETTANIVRTGNAGTVSSIHAPAPPPTVISNVITYTGNSISGYTGPQYPLNAGSTLRFGYMIGVSYEINKQLMFDALIQQGTAKQNVLSGYNINSSLSAPYFRLSVGYKIK